MEPTWRRCWGANDTNLSGERRSLCLIIQHEALHPSTLIECPFSCGSWDSGKMCDDTDGIAWIQGQEEPGWGCHRLGFKDGLE